MAEQELKEKIVEAISQKQTYGITEEFKTEDLGHGGWQAWTETTKVNNAEIADALIAAGLTFDKTTERAFKLYLKYTLECERCVDRMNGVCNASAEEKADCANRTLSLYKEYAEKESEGKDE